jgi:hypothetical protein
MKKEKSRLADLASKLRSSEERISETGKMDIGSIDPNPVHGEKTDFRKLTITLPPVAYNLLVQESARRKMAKERNHLLSAILREAVMLYLGRQKEGGAGA